MDQLGSFIKVHRDIVFKKSKAKIDIIEAERAKRDAKYLANEQSHVNWWRSWFKRKPLTIEQIKDKVATECRGSLYHCGNYPSIYAWGTYDVMKRLLTAAQAAGTEGIDEIMYISTEDWKALS